MIGIVFIGDLKYCPYLNKYTTILEKNNVEYEVLYWEREGSLQKYPNNYISFNLKSKLNRPPLMKVKDFIMFRAWLRKEIRQKNYEKIIVLSTLSGILIYDILLKKYKGKYIFDIRDYSYEHNTIFKNIEEKIIRESFFTCISSEGFKNFLPSNYDYKIAHNLVDYDLNHRKNFNKKSLGEPLNIVWIGAVRYFDHQKKIIDALSNDERFNMIFHGSGADLEKFQDYCTQKNISNISFTGEYHNNDKHLLLKNADILNNNYKTEKVMEVKYALSNKYYDGLIYKIPQLVETETFKATLVSEKSLGIALDPDNANFKENLINYYFSINEDDFNKNCDEVLEKVLIENRKYLESIEDFINF